MALSGLSRTWAELRHRTYEVMEIGRGEDSTSRFVDDVIITLILLNIAAFCLETVHEVHEAYAWEFHYFEVFSVAVFTIEYITRIWASVEVPFLRRLPPWKARLRFARRPFLVIDLLAILPFYLGHMLGIDLRILRALRLLRLFKLSRYSPAMHTLLRVLANESRALIGAGVLLLTVLLFSSTGMYFIESHAQPDKFGSVPLAAYWAMTTLTTVGYGDVAPITPLGKFWAMITMLFGLCVLALPVAIISTGFSQEVGRRDFVVTWSLMSRVPLFTDLDASHIAEILPLLHAHNLPPNVEVIAADTNGAAMYFIASGRVRLAEPNGSMEFKTGDFFGAVALVQNGKHGGSYTTTTRCRLLKLYREDFFRLEATRPEIGALIRKIAAERATHRLEKLPFLPKDPVGSDPA
ncbi:MAG: cyclic nucleotide-gated ion channel [Hyphomicrobiaceae bacterium]